METKLDRFGRIQIPKRVRENLSLRAGSVLEIEEGESCLVLKVRREVPNVVLEDGVLVYTEEAAGDHERAMDAIQRSFKEIRPRVGPIAWTRDELHER